MKIWAGCLTKKEHLARFFCPTECKKIPFFGSCAKQQKNGKSFWQNWTTQILRVPKMAYFVPKWEFSCCRFCDKISTAENERRNLSHF